nr:hypothetical protein [uncultured Solibaculum sp.]
MKKRSFLLAGAFVAVSVLAFFIGQASKGKGPLAMLLLKEKFQDDSYFEENSKFSMRDGPKTTLVLKQQCSASKDHPDTEKAEPIPESLVPISNREKQTDWADHPQEVSFFPSEYEEINSFQSKEEGKDRQEETAPMPLAPYILSTNTRKFHRPTCREVKKIRPQHYATANTRKEAMGMNCSPCQRCKP